jgi:hypothetical protein
MPSQVGGCGGFGACHRQGHRCAIGAERVRCTRTDRTLASGASGRAERLDTVGTHACSRERGRAAEARRGRGSRKRRPNSYEFQQIRYLCVHSDAKSTKMLDGQATVIRAVSRHSG